ncbi:MAG: Asp-tRNA(Asn)/Glu-tRNA(Gln) amidotransferase subunit GatA [Gemmatimonadaceae bacterium]|nr:Asp-tRNA(Asn)/Glu-tRNA(Gln) amidotransferase subunit GatA [Gemmatimonadaceae bacterium]
MNDLCCTELSQRVNDGQLAVKDVVTAAFKRADSVIAGHEGLNIILHCDRETSLKAAGKTATHIARAEPPGLLSGVPVVLKDNIATLGLPTTCGSRILDGYVSPYEATAVTRMRAQGAIVIAKTNMDEFAMGSSTENSAYGPARNPHDPSRVPGGSSGGSAACVAAGIAPLGFGSETGGSVRQPAAFCGVVGVKPTYGRVSRFGLVAFASSLDQIGVFGRTVNDAARGLEAIAGFDPYDSTTSDAPVPEYSLAATHKDQSDLRGLVFGWPREYFPESLDPGIRTLCERARDRLRSLGAEVREVSLPHTLLAIPVYYIVAPAEASSNLARFDGVRYGLRTKSDFGLRGMYEDTRSEGFGPEVTRRILLGTYVLSAGYYDAYYRKAQMVRTLIAQDFNTVFNSGVHLLLTPTTPTTAFEIGAIKDPYEMYLSDIFTATANLAGVPAMSLPIGRVNGLPVGGQIIAPYFREEEMFRAACALEHALGKEAHS